jgi:trimeric autotransporter adhesin
MKNLLAIPLFVLFSILCNAQQWDSLGGGIKGIYAGEGYGVSAQVEYNNNLYIGGGLIDTAGDVAINNIAEWNGTTWLNVDTGTGLIGEVYSLYEYNGELYAGGIFDSIGGKAICSIAKYNGVSWSAVGSGLPNDSDCEIYSMCVYNGELYIGGAFDSIGGIAANNIAKWNGTTFSALGFGISKPPLYGGVSSLCIYKGELYAGGAFDSAGGIPANNIAKWDGTNWTQIGSGINGGINAMVVYDDSLYIGGEFDTAGGKRIYDIATWNGTDWSSVGSGIPYYPRRNNQNVVGTLCVYDSTVIAGGLIDTAGNIPVNNIAFWNGTNWGKLSTGIDNAVYSVHSFNSVLYAGGEFDKAGGIPVNNIAQWTGPLAVPELAIGNSQITVYPNPGNGMFVFKIINKQLSPGIIEISNMLGEKVLTTKLNNQNNEMLDLSSQPNGVYFYRVVTDIGAAISEGKLVIEK